MSCFRPLQAFRRPDGDVRLGPCPGDCRAMELPCGRCIGCKMDRGGQWKIRLMHEAMLWPSNLFVTLTYAPDQLPRSLSLEYSDFQSFMRRLRRRVSGVALAPDGVSRPVRFFVAGEYGAERHSCRPHFHAILFNCRLRDMYSFGKYFRSDIAESAWKKGHVVIGQLNSARAGYVAGYNLKKQYGAAAREAYEDVLDLSTGELTARRPEFVEMSTNPGIGAWWFARFGSDVLPGDFAVVEGSKYKVPRFYLERFKRTADRGLVEEVLEKRYQRAAEQRGENTPERRAVREEVALRNVAFYSQRDGV